MITRGQNFKIEPLNITGSSTFGRYPKISNEKTVNMFVSDNFMVPYAGYGIGIANSAFNDATTGRALKTSAKLGKMIGVMNENVYLVNITFNQRKQEVTFSQATKIGDLQTTSGIVYISENNKPQICLSDGVSIYIYDPTLSPSFQTITTSFVPGFIDFHDTYFLAAAKGDSFYSPAANNTWRLSAQNDGTSWPDDAASIGLIQTKPDNTQAVFRFPGKGNMIFAMGKTVTEPWFDVGYQLFPYQRNTSANIDYGCISPATIATIGDYVVWLSVNEKGGPVVVYSNGGNAVPITTDGFNYMLSNLQSPEDSQAFMFRQDGHTFYHINFYSDNISFYIDFLKDGSKKIYNATDENGNYFIASSVAFFNNQYYFVSRNNGNLYVFDTTFTTYDGAEIPRIRVCKNIRNIQQEPFIVNDVGFTIESGETDYLAQDLGILDLAAENGNLLITESGDNLIDEQDNIVSEGPRVDMSISIDGGAHYSSYDVQHLPTIGNRINKLAWWQLGWCNDFVPQFRFWGLGRFVATDGYVNIRQ